MSNYPNLAPGSSPKTEGDGFVTTPDGTQTFYKDWGSGQPIVFHHGWPLSADDWDAQMLYFLEKGYRVWGADITPYETPYEAGLGFAVKLDKGDFIGRDALAAAETMPLERKLACLVLADPRSVALGSEPVRVDGEILGRVTSGGYGYSVDRSIAYAYVPPDLAEPGREVEVEVFGTWVPGTIAEEPVFDPAGDRIRA